MPLALPLFCLSAYAVGSLLDAMPPSLAFAARAWTDDSRICKLRGGAAESSPEESTFAMLKPDVAGDEATVEGIKQLIAQAGLSVEREERCTLTRGDCEAFYAEHAERAFFGELVEFMSSGPVIKLELRGPDAVRKWRELIGPTNSEKAREEAPASVRALFGTDQQANAAHGSDAAESAERELGLMFSSSA